LDAVLIDERRLHFAIYIQPMIDTRNANWTNAAQLARMLSKAIPKFITVRSAEPAKATLNNKNLEARAQCFTKGAEARQTQVTPERR
jgi:hypothetical protein